MLGSHVLNFLTGSGIKMVTQAVLQAQENKKQINLAMMNAENDRIKVIAEMEQNESARTKNTRTVIALVLVTTYCFILIWHVVCTPELEYNIMVDNKINLLTKIFGCKGKHVITISAGSLLWGFTNFIEIIAGYYFTGGGKS